MSVVSAGRLSLYKLSSKALRELLELLHAPKLHPIRTLKAFNPEALALGTAASLNLAVATLHLFLATHGSF